MPSYTLADWQAGVDRRNADRTRVADLGTLLDEVEEKANGLERRTRELLETEESADSLEYGNPL